MTLVVALAMTTLGFAGLSGSFNALSGDVDALVQPHPAFPSAAAELYEGLMSGYLASPLRRALTIANLLVSGMLVIGSFAMTGRARWAPWWATQALWANAIYTLAAGAGLVRFFVAHRSEVIELLRAMVEAQVAAGELAVPEGELMPSLSLTFTLMVGVTALMFIALAGIYVLLLRATKREDVRQFITGETKAG